MRIAAEYEGSNSHVDVSIHFLQNLIRIANDGASATASRQTNA
jgi:hypothetical protein